MGKRKYTNSTSAEDGLQAVNAYQFLLSKDQPPDIVFMDITMPVMNGFEATRRIREIEREHYAHLPTIQAPPSCLIIALTGLASARDQSEAFMSGFDMFITKPVSFSDISRLLDNWESNGGGARMEGLPHRAVAANEGEVGKQVDKEDEKHEENESRMGKGAKKEEKTKKEGRIEKQKGVEKSKERVKGHEVREAKSDRDVEGDTGGKKREDEEKKRVYEEQKGRICKEREKEGGKLLDIENADVRERVKVRVVEEEREKEGRTGVEKAFHTSTEAVEPSSSTPVSETDTTTTM